MWCDTAPCTCFTRMQHALLHAGPLTSVRGPCAVALRHDPLRACHPSLRRPILRWLEPQLPLQGSTLLIYMR